MSLARAAAAIPSPVEETSTPPPPSGAAGPDGVLIERASARGRGADVALVVLAAAASVALLRFAADFFVPLVTGILLAYTLQPVVNLLERLRIPRTAAATLVVFAVTGMVIGGAYALADDVSAAVGVLPDAARKLRVALRESGLEGDSPIARVQQAAKELDAVAADSSAAARPARPVPESGLGQRLQTFLLIQMKDAAYAAGQLGAAAALALFVLAGGDAFRRKLMRFVGPSLARKRVTMELLGDVVTQVQRYLLVMLVTNVTIGAATGTLLAAGGLENAAAWGVATALLHFVPYLGAGVAAIGIAVAGFLQFESLTIATLYAGVTVLLATSIGLFFQTWLQSRAGNLNAAAVFASLLFFGWAWGAWGLVLGGPITAVAKAIADRLAPPVGDLLG